jgi:hypothetical protein
MNLQFNPSIALTGTPSSSSLSPSHSRIIDFEQIASFDYSHIKGIYI